MAIDGAVQSSVQSQVYACTRRIACPRNCNTVRSSLWTAVTHALTASPISSRQMLKPGQRNRRERINRSKGRTLPTRSILATSTTPELAARHLRLNTCFYSSCPPARHLRLKTPIKPTMHLILIHQSIKTLLLNSRINYLFLELHFY